jgi:hydrogenase expression/formation protein HypC
MCLAVPAKLMEVAGDRAVADLHGNRVDVNTMLVPEVAAGDWVLIHAGFAIQHLDEADAQRTWAVLEDLGEAEAADAAELPPDRSAGAP